MSSNGTNPHARLERVFHEPHRLSIMTKLLGKPGGITFTDLKVQCDLTDGNLSRHLKALTQSKSVSIKKRFVRNRPQTTVSLSKRGREDFLAYLQALESVLLDAAEKLSDLEVQPTPSVSLFGRRVAKA